MNVITILCDTLRRDHCGPYNLGKPLNEAWSKQAPEWAVPTPNMDRLAARGVTFTNCWCGSTPCMPARRDVYTGRYEFLERGWGPLEEWDRDLPRQISGPPNESIQKMMAEGLPISYLVTDHFHLWEKGSGNYHMGYSGFEFIRGSEADAWRTEPIDFPHPGRDRFGKNERHWRNIHGMRHSEADWFAPQVFTQAANWLEKNHTHENFYLHIDCFDPHEPWDPPEELLKMFDPRGYTVELPAAAPYAKWEGLLSEEEFTSFRARYAAKVVLVDRWLGKLLDVLDRHNLWDDTLVFFTTDHGTYNGDHGRLGKLQTHEHDAVGHIPLIAAYPGGRGERRDQLVQLVDLYPTTLAAVGRPIPENIHGVNLLPVLENPAAETRDYAIAGQFGCSVSITDSEWILHQSPIPENQPLYWYGYTPALFFSYVLGPVENGRRAVSNVASWNTPTWLSDKKEDINELNNLADERPDKLHTMQAALRETLESLHAPPEQLHRLGL